MKFRVLSLPCLAFMLIALPIWAGTLEPPPGAPAPTMKTIAEAEPRVPLHASDFPLTISNAGSYYLTENVAGSSAAITVTVDDVTIDLSGYKLGSAGTPFSISAPSYVTLRNGNVVGTNAFINMTLGDHATLEKLGVLNSRVSLGNSAHVSDCSFDESGPPMFICGSYCTVERTRFFSTLNGEVSVGGASLLSEVQLTNPGGLTVGGNSVVSRSTMSFLDVELIATGDSVTLIDSIFSSSGDVCVLLLNDSLISNCVIKGGATRSAFVGQRSRVQSSEIDSGLEIGNGSTVKDSVFGGRGGIALKVASDSTVAGNSCTDGSPGLKVEGSGNRIEGNTLVSNVTFGLIVTGTGNTILRNAASKNSGGNYQIAGGNDAGPISTAAAATSPWANIAY